MRELHIQFTIAEVTECPAQPQIADKHLFNIAVPIVNLAKASKLTCVYSQHAWRIAAISNSNSNNDSTSCLCNTSSTTFLQGVPAATAARNSNRQQIATNSLCSMYNNT